MSSNDFWESTPREFHNRLQGYQEIQLKENQVSWEQSRFVAYWSVVPHINSKKRDLKITDIAKFPWEKQIKSGLMSREEILKKLAGEGMKMSKKIKVEINE